jgi:hypothetical protein
MISTDLRPFSFCTTRQNDGWLVMVVYINGAPAHLSARHSNAPYVPAQQLVVFLLTDLFSWSAYNYPASLGGDLPILAQGTLLTVARVVC